jgi:uncharacterized membrane-anchored protein
MKNKMIKGLIAAIFFQFIVLTGMYVKAALPLWFGTEIQVNTIPVDPRSLFRGNYARLRYEFSQIDMKHFSGTEKLRDGEIVFISVKADKNGIYKFSSASLTKPENGIFLQGRIKGHRWSKEAHIKYGIEAFFAPKIKALELERKMRKGAVAVLMVSSDGKARIKNILSH